MHRADREAEREQDARLLLGWHREPGKIEAELRIVGDNALGEQAAFPRT